MLILTQNKPAYEKFYPKEFKKANIKTSIHISIIFNVCFIIFPLFKDIILYKYILYINFSIEMVIVSKVKCISN